MADKILFFKKEYWVDWWKPPKLSWWINPSGSTPKPWSAGDYILQSPSSAHSISAIISILVGLIAFALPKAIGLLVIVFAMVVKGQLQKADALFAQGPNAYNWRNIIWRTVIGTVAGAFFIFVIPFIIHTIGRLV